MREELHDPTTTTTTTTTTITTTTTTTTTITTKTPSRPATPIMLPLAAVVVDKDKDNDKDNDKDKDNGGGTTMGELSRLQQNGHHPSTIHRRCSEQWPMAAVADPGGRPSHYALRYYEILFTGLSILARAYTVYMNVRLACDYYRSGRRDYAMWTSVCIVLPICVTTLIYANMCHQDGKFKNGICKALQTFWLVVLSSFFFRYWNALVYSIKCKRAELQGRKEDQIKFHKLTMREENDVAFIRLFECFLETAPQKILLITIVLGQSDRIHNVQIINLCLYFGGMAWCLAVYHRSNRYAQIDKHDIKVHGFILQLCWHFCISVARTICISLVASIFPIWTIIACAVHAVLFGFVTFIVDRPKFAATLFCNFLFTCILGFVYVFTYIPVRDAPTFRKYCVYYTICFSEIVFCVGLFAELTPSNLFTLTYLFYFLCAIPLVFYIVGIVFMIIYYTFYHPRITARKSKYFINNN